MCITSDLVNEEGSVSLLSEYFASSESWEAAKSNPSNHIFDVGQERAHDFFLPLSSPGRKQHYFFAFQAYFDFLI